MKKKTIDPVLNELADVQLKHPDLILNAVNKAITDREAKIVLTSPNRTKLIKRFNACINRPTKEAVESCILKESTIFLNEKGIISKKDVEMKLEEVGYDGLIEEVDERLSRAIEKSKEIEKENLLDELR